ncbi:zinc-ribbon domain-containing protein [Nocardioides sp. DS6]|uniref:Zinc-ribbon domain-containing protein n=1 Tax=Nocardioides eburneus TaxID=3231482 RepID=A0ABV3SY33_9ACTN
MKYCGQCGSQLRAGARFCSNCGATVRTDATAPGPTTPPPATTSPTRYPLYADQAGPARAVDTAPEPIAQAQVQAQTQAQETAVRPALPPLSETAVIPAAAESRTRATPRVVVPEGAGAGAADGTDEHHASPWVVSVWVLCTVLVVVLAAGIWLLGH